MTPTPTTPPATHSPLPWSYSATDKLNHHRAFGINRDIEVEGDESMVPSTETIAEVCASNVPGVAEADAAFIVAACNGHAALVQVCKEIIEHGTDDWDARMRTLRSALASAGETT